MNFVGLCDRCRVHPSEMVLGQMCLCAPCAELIAWTHGVQASVDPGASSPIMPAMANPMAFVGAAPAKPPAKDDSIVPWGRFVLILGGTAALALVGYWVFKIGEEAQETRRGIMRVVENHPEVVKAFV